jgi:lantibiotic transport system permease protein
MTFIHAIQSEWLKTKRSASNWLSIIGGFFIPTMLTIAAFYFGKTINAGQGNGWNSAYGNAWRDMAVFLLPMGMILAGSLITQIENKNNTWKQVHATPQRFTIIFFSKFAVILIMTVKFFVFFNVGVLLYAILPSLFLDGGFPEDAFPFWDILKLNLKIFVACMPILAIQYLLSLNFKNFLVPIGIGFLGLIGTMIAFNFVKHIYLSPFAFTLYAVLPKKVWFNPTVYALIAFALITGLNYYLYMRKKDKG